MVEKSARKRHDSTAVFPDAVTLIVFLDKIRACGVPFGEASAVPFPDLDWSPDPPGMWSRYGPLQNTEFACQLFRKRDLRLPCCEAREAFRIEQLFFRNAELSYVFLQRATCNATFSCFKLKSIQQMLMLRQRLLCPVRRYRQCRRSKCRWINLCDQADVGDRVSLQRPFSRFTFPTLHSPPRRVLIPRAVNWAAMARSDVCPAA
jgi:hypothetical protein